jgi:AraC-like DNA-binding protein
VALKVATEFDAIELLEASSRNAGWEVTYRQVDGGKLQTEVELADYGELALMRERGNRRLEVAGRPPDRMLVALAPMPGTCLTLNGISAPPDSLYLLWPDEELHVAAGPGADVISMPVPIDDVLASAAKISAAGIDEARVAGVQCCFDSAQVRALRGLMLESVESTGGIPSPAADLKLALARTLVSRANVTSEGAHKRSVHCHLALKRAIEYIEGHLLTTISVVDVCDYAGVSLSTLERLFKRELGLLPSSYVRTRRLDSARRALRSRRWANRTVAEIATNCGFGHLGRFSAAYREHFGVYPSEEARRT